MTSSYTDYFLRATDESELWSVLTAAGLAEEVFDSAENHTYKSFKAGVNLDVIGIIYEPSGQMVLDPEGFEFPEMVAIPGYHANLRATLTPQEELDISSITIAAPSTPIRVWA